MANRQQKSGQTTPEAYIKTRARSLEIASCYVNSDWQEQGLAHVFVVRRHPKGTFTVGGYLVDTFCLGVKDCFYSFSIDNYELESMLSSSLRMYGERWQEVDYAVAHNIVYGGLEYASDLGFKPHDDWAIAQYILNEDNDDVPLIEYEFGKNGRPQLIVKNYHVANIYTAVLNKSVGPGNYDVVVTAGNFDCCDDDFDEDDYDEDDGNMEEKMTELLLDCVQDMSDDQEDLYHAAVLGFAGHSRDVSKEMKRYADLVHKKRVTRKKIHKAHVDAVISLENVMAECRENEDGTQEKFILAATFMIYAQISCTLILDMSDEEVRHHLSSPERYLEFLNKCDKEAQRMLDKLKK